jgi:hypothetical protein
MKVTHLFYSVLCISSALYGQTTQDGLRVGEWSTDSFETLFSNPVCPEQTFVSYRAAEAQATKLTLATGEAAVYPSRAQVPEIKLGPEGIPTLGGGFRTTIPANVYCDAGDFARSTEPLMSSVYRDKESPYNRLLEWIRSTRAGDSLFVASFSLSMDNVAKTICEAKERGVETKVFIHDVAAGNAAYNRLKTCLADQLIEFPEGKGRLAHMKSVIIEYKNPEHDSLKDKVRVSFQSGNISSGTWGHHENWNFVTQTSQHWFSQDHLCLRDAIRADSVNNMTLIYKAIEDCRRLKGIDAVRGDDQEMRSYFIPKSGGTYDDRKELKKLILEVQKAKSVWIAAHHLTAPDLLKALQQRLDKRDQDGFSVKVLVDSEVFWANTRLPFQTDTRVTYEVEGKTYPSPSSLTSYCKWGIDVKAAKEVRCSLFSQGDFAQGPGLLEKAGAELKVFESNHMGKMLFHNKIIIFEYATPEGDRSGSVFMGAGNLSSAGFEKNFENYYLVSIPHVYEAFRQQFTLLFNRGSYTRDLPVTWDYKTQDGRILPLPVP